MPDHPNPPWRVYASVRNGLGCDRPCWLIASGSEFSSMYSSEHDADKPIELLTIINHPRNDPEAVEIIKKAKGET